MGETCSNPKAQGGLGFRNFEVFNMAMVAKQAWNIVQNPNSLAANLIKARYDISHILYLKLLWNKMVALFGVVFGMFDKFFFLGVSGRLVVVIIFMFCMTHGCMEVIIDGCSRLNLQMYISY
jgi:hypothetical protein